MPSFAHQVQGTEFLLKVQRGILADDPGLGKTKQIIDALDCVPEFPIAISAPPSLCGLWQSEIKRWSDNLGTVLNTYYSSNPGLDILRARQNVYILYDGMLRSYLPELKKLGIRTFVADEAHRFKNRNSSRSKSIASLLRTLDDDARVWLATGTPIVNRADDIWHLLHLIDRHKYSSYWRWVNENMTVVDEYIPHLRSHVRSPGHLRNPDYIKDELSKILLRRLKEDVLDLPEKIITQIPVRLEGDHLKAYKHMRDHLYLELSNKSEIAAVNPAVELNYLRMIAISHHLVDPNLDTLEGSKLEALMDLLDSFKGQKVCIFSQFAGVISRLRKLLEKTKRQIVVVDSSIPPTERLSAVKYFESLESDAIFLGTILTCGEGFTIVSSQIAIFMDLYWTPTANNQTADRLHRIGTRGVVNIYHIYAENTVEGYVNSLLRYKETLFNVMIPSVRLIRGIQTGEAY